MKPITFTASLLMLAWASVATAAGEFRVNTTTTGNQSQPAVAAAPDGRFVVVWESGDGSLGGIWAQRYSAVGIPDGPEFRVNAFRLNRQTNPAVAMDASGNFVVLWNSASHLLEEGTGIFGQRYAADGTPRGGMFKLNHSGRDIYALVGVGMDAAGNFVAVWPERGNLPLPIAKNVVPNIVVAQRYSANGQPLGELIEVENALYKTLRMPVVGVDSRGGFVVAWNADEQSGLITEDSSLGLGLGIFARRYAADGKAQGAVFQVDKTQNGVLVDRPAVAVGADGEFAVAWQTHDSTLFPLGVALRRYGPDGSARSAPATVDARMLRRPSLAIGPAGELVVVAHSDGIYSRRYDSSGLARGPALRLDSGAATDAVLMPGVAADGLGGFVATWQSFLQDGDGRGVYARIERP